MEKYLPDIYTKSIYTVPYDNLKQEGIKCLLFDLDNTLVPYYVQNVDEKTKNLIENLKKDFNVIIFSNSPKKRIENFKETLQIDCLASAKKPLKKNFIKILNEFKLTESEVAIIGDQLYTDILGGNRVGVMTVLVNPISKKYPFWTKIGRINEKRIINGLKKRDLFFEGRYYE